MGHEPTATAQFCFVTPLGERAALEALVIAREVRRLGAACEVDGRAASIKSKLRRANSAGARLAVVIGDSELERGVLQLKDLVAHTQEELPRETAPGIIADRLRGSQGATVASGGRA
jgi:histidyl-tRNA synthetase